MKRISVVMVGMVILTMSASSPAAPNIILILTDDHGWSQLSAQMDPDLPESQSKYLQTPNMVRLMTAGRRFTSGYSPAPLCTPTRRSILCGTSTARSGPEFKSPWVPADHLTIPRALKGVNSNYRCAHFGKWGEQMISTPEECGYDASDGMTGNNTGGMPASLGVNGGHADGPPHFIDNDDPKRTRSITTRAIRFMKEQSQGGKPFYVQVSYYAQHLSVVTSEQTLAKWEARGIPDRRYPPAWAAMMEELDQGVGRLLDAVEEFGIRDETYIFFTADNGGRGSVPGGNDALPETNAPLTGAKHSLYEGGIRVPFFARGPGITPGSVCRTPVVGYDFLPTFHDLAGGDSSELTQEIDGASFTALLGEDTDALLVRTGQAIFFHRPDRGFSAVRRANEKLMLFWNNDGTVKRRELYLVGRNPTESGRDVSQDRKEQADELQELLLSYLKSVNAATPKPRQRGQRKRSERIEN
jgi:arylsulfatase A-like enzyme